MNKNKAISSIGSVFSVVFSVSWLFAISPALAHHPNGGEVPHNFITGFMSGLGHPVIGIDHLVFVIAIGLLAVLNQKRGMIIPTAFVIATAIGTGIHLQSVNLPVPELIISASVLIVGIFLARKKRANLALLITIVAIAGIFHGYAYGESIVGAETNALVAYIVGFCTIQLGISAIACYLGNWAIDRLHKYSLLLRFAGFTICGIGVAFLSNTVLG